MKVHELSPDLTIYEGDVREVLKTLPDESVQCVVTSPPYFGLRDYGTAQWEGGDSGCDHKPSTTPKKRGVGTSTLDGAKATVGHQQEGYAAVCLRCGARRIDNQIGLEPTPEAYVQTMVELFREVRRVLRKDGTLWLNLGDSYAGSGVNDGTKNPGMSKAAARGDVKQTSRPNTRIAGLKPKDLCMIPERVAIALQADGWYLRAKPPWIKRNCMPESVGDRPGTAHESIFLLSKGERYFYDAEAVRVTGTVQSPAAMSWQRDGKHSELLVPGQSKPQHRPDREKPNQDRVGKRTYTGFNQRWDAAESQGGIQPGRNRRTSDWWFESLDFAIQYHSEYLAHLVGIKEHGGLLLDEEGAPLGFMVNPKPFSEAHFAVWPPDLVKPMILASTSPKACPTCGAPWERKTERAPAEPDRTQRSTSHYDTKEKYGAGNGGNSGFDKLAQRMREGMHGTATTGWTTTCACEGNDGSGKCRVLDIFHGSGTTGEVAIGLGRSYWGCELNPKYIELSIRARLNNVQSSLLGQI